MDTGIWSIWIDNTDGELAMDKNARAKREVEVVERAAYEAVLSKIREWADYYSAAPLSIPEEAKELLAVLGREQA